MNYRKESGSRKIQALSPGLLTMIVKIRLKHVSMNGNRTSQQSSRAYFIQSGRKSFCFVSKT